MREWEFRRQRRWSFAAAILCVLVIVSLAAEFVYARATNAPAPAKDARSPRTAQVRIPLSELTDSSLHFYTADVNGTVLRFHGDSPDQRRLCRRRSTPARSADWAGYRQEGQNVVCRNCGATIYIPSIGERADAIPFR